jgi:hypothetical protein
VEEAGLLVGEHAAGRPEPRDDRRGCNHAAGRYRESRSGTRANR